MKNRLSEIRRWLHGLVRSAGESIYFRLFHKARVESDPNGTWWRLWSAWAFVLSADKHWSRGNRQEARRQLASAKAMLLTGGTSNDQDQAHSEARPRSTEEA